MVDPISDMLNRIRNAQAVSKPTVVVPFSSFKYAIAEILAENGFVGKVEKKGRKINNSIEITLKYADKRPAASEARPEGRPAIEGLKMISKPGQKIYSSYSEIRPVRGGYGIAIISTPKGLMTNKRARKQKIGGEVICEVW
jgi:small subunit ribosomal protein S8